LLKRLAREVGIAGLGHLDEIIGKLRINRDKLKV